MASTLLLGDAYRTLLSKVVVRRERRDDLHALKMGDVRDWGIYGAPKSESFCSKFKIN